MKKAERLVQQGDHEAALAQATEVLGNYYEELGDRALFRIGILYAQPGNPSASHRKALAAFRRVEEDFPQSPLRGQAGIFASVLQELVDVKEELHSLEEDKLEKVKRLARLDREMGEKEKRIVKYHRSVVERETTINRLHAQISELQSRLDRVEAQLSELKKVDLGIEQRRRPVLQ